MHNQDFLDSLKPDDKVGLKYGGFNNITSEVARVIKISPKRTKFTVQVKNESKSKIFDKYGQQYSTSKEKRSQWFYHTYYMVPYTEEFQRNIDKKKMLRFLKTVFSNQSFLESLSYEEMKDIFNIIPPSDSYKKMFPDADCELMRKKN